MSPEEELNEIEQSARGLRDLFPDLSRRYVPGEGSHQAEAFIIGEAPGATEDQALRPFVGQAGQVLRQLMRFAGLYSTESTSIDKLHREFTANCWITNVVKFRPPGNRVPTESEIKAFRGMLIAEWQAVGAPRLIIPVGGTALRAVTGRQLSILRYAGKPHKYRAANNTELIIWPMVHPAFGLRVTEAQDFLEKDWEALGRWRQTFHPD